VALASVVALALGTAAAGSAAAATQPNIPGYNQAQVNRAIGGVTKTSSQLHKALHPRSGHRGRHRSRHA
jgi:hypothetical protein